MVTLCHSYFDQKILKKQNCSYVAVKRISLFISLDSPQTRLGTFLGLNGWDRVKPLVDPKRTVELMVPKFAKIHCCKEAIVVSSKCDFALCLTYFNEYQNDWGGGGMRWRRMRRHDGNKEGTVPVGKHMEPWTKCWAYTVAFMKDVYCEATSVFPKRNRRGERNVENATESCWGCGRVF